MPHFSAPQQRAVERLARDLDELFGSRLESLVVYLGHHGDGSIHSCALIDALSFKDLSACLPFVESWHHRGIAVPLLLSRDELERSLDVFPVEYAAIAADHQLVRGDDPFAGLTVAADDVRRACEAQAKSHLIHLREGFLESHGETTRIARLITASAAPLRALLTNIARLPAGAGALETAHLSDESLARLAESKMGITGGVIREVLNTSHAGHSTIADPSALLARYVPATQKIWEYVDGWRS